MRFTLHHQRAQSFQDALVNLVHRRNGSTEEFWALRDVSFDVQPGETLGIIGQNGSGKSTILKLVTRILDPTHGKIDVNGRVSALIELGAGFHPDLTGRENIYLNGSIMGFGHKEMDRRFDRILAFSELERFIDTPVKHYSSGMYMRLGFSVAISVDPDILIIDEVLAVGDESFQRKCMERIEEFRRQGKTIIFVSHDLEKVERLCDRVVWLQGGVVRRQGGAVRMMEGYLEAMRRHDDEVRDAEQHAASAERHGTAPPFSATNRPRVHVVDVQPMAVDRQEQYSFQTGETVRLRVCYRVEDSSAALEYGIEVRRIDGLLVHRSSQLLPPMGRRNADGGLVAEMTVPSLTLLAGTYDLIPIIREAGETTSPANVAGCRLSVWNASGQSGIVPLAYSWVQTGERGPGRDSSLASSAI